MDAESREAEIAIAADTALAAAGQLGLKETGRTMPVIPGLLLRLYGGAQWMVSADMTKFIEVTSGYKEPQ